MNESTPAGWQLIRAIGVVLFLCAVVGAGIYGIVVALDHLRSGVAAGVVTASATILVSVFTVVWSRRADRRRAIEEAARARKLPLYDELARFWLQTLLLADELTEAEMTERWQNFHRETLHTLVLWMSEPVLAAYNRIRSISYRNLKAGLEEGTPDLIFAFEDLLFAIRKDLGHSNAGVQRGDLLRLWINDVDETLAGSRSSPSAQEPAA